MNNTVSPHPLNKLAEAITNSFKTATQELEDKERELTEDEQRKADLTKATDALRHKYNILVRRVDESSSLTKARVPFNFRWIACSLGVQVANTNVSCEPIDNKFCQIAYRPKRFDLGTSVDVGLAKVARTFCLLEDFEVWLDKWDAGVKKHQLEIERQVSDKICRLKTYVNFS